MKKIIIAFAFFISVNGFQACSKFDSINTNPNVTGTVTPSMLATNLILNITQASADKSFTSPYLVSKHIAWGEMAQAEQYNYFGRTGFGGMPVLTNVNKMISLSADVDKNGYTGLGLFIRAYKQFNLSISLGDIPYSDALQGEGGNIKPKYDTQKDVMLQILKDLDNADKSFAAARNFGGDPIFNGNVQTWRKVVNSFRLKVLMSLSLKESDPDLKIKETFAAVSALPLLAGNSDNLQLVFSNKAGQLYPYNNTINKYTAYGMMSNVLTDSLKKMNDYRLFYFANPAATAIAGGKQPSDWDAYIGVDPTADFSQIVTLYTAGKYSQLNARYIQLPAGEPLMRISYAEQNFILAEAVLRGWISGNAQNYYNAGITAAMNFIVAYTPDDPLYNHGRKIDGPYIQSYLASSAIALSPDATKALKQIGQQKYILYFMQHPWDAYYEYRRTGYPALPINPATSQNIDDKNSMPLRWMYATDEYTYNGDNLKEALTRQYGGQDKTNGVMWILK